MSWLTRSFGYMALIAPAGLMALVSVPFGRCEPAVWRWQRLASRVIDPSVETAERRPDSVRVLVHAGVSVLLGLVGWIVIGAIAVMAVRGALYGLVDPGPYGDSWGGPSLTGAWLTHAAISAVGIVASLLVLRGIALLHVHLTRGLLGARMKWWLMPLTLLLCAGAALFVIGFISQLE